MKRFSYILAILAVFGLSSCMKDAETVTPGYEGVSASLIKELGLDEPEMPVRLGFALPGEKINFSTKASVVGGDEDPVDYIKTLYLVCFTREGIYLGWRKASLIGSEQSFTHDGLNCQGRELFEGTVPSRTARIHFLGNVGIGVADGYAPSNIPGNDQIGGNENTLIKSAKMTVGITDITDRTICYWGFHGENSSEDMKAWLALATTNPDGTVTYSKKDGHNVHLVRDRARVDFGYMLDFKRSDSAVADGRTVIVNGNSYTISGGKITIGNRQYAIDKNPTDYTIQSIHWILSNGLNKGYLAPYHDENQTDHFTGYFDTGSSPALKEDRLTEYDKADAKRYTATEADMMQIYDGTNSIDAPLFLFEDENLESNPPKIILKVVYKVDGQTNTKTKYHTLMMLNESHEPCKIYRNHNYILDIFGIPWEGLGYTSFDDAVNSVTYANNQTISISEEVPAVNDGRFQLSVQGETSIIFQNPAYVNTAQTVYFTYQAMAGESTDAVKASDFKAAWTGDVRSSFASPNVTVTEVSNNGTVFKGAITFTLGTSINSALQGGQIELKDKLTGMTRFINVYTIDKFNFLPEGASKLDLVATGESRNVNGVSCPTYKMDVRIPGDYPLGLYPIKMRIASITLNPFKVEQRSVGSTTLEGTVPNVAVAMGGTENGSKLDGETLAGMSFTTDAADRLQWNYHADGEPWDFWFVDTIISKPTMDKDGETVEDTRDKVYTFYFDDIRGLRAAANRPVNVGLFFKIKYFGDAVPVTP